MKSPKPPPRGPYELGRLAHGQGVAYDACPYEGGRDAEDWKWGHYDTQTEAKKKAKAGGAR